MRKSTKPGGLLRKQALLKSQSLTLAVIPVVFLLVSISITPQAKTVPTKLLKAEAVKVGKTAKAGLNKGCLPEPGTEAYRKLMSPTGPNAPPPPVKRVGYLQFQTNSDGQWCWKQSCEHIEWVCSEGVAEDVNGCCVRCCMEGVPGYCSESRCCESRLEE